MARNSPRAAGLGAGGRASILENLGLSASDDNKAHTNVLSICIYIYI